MILLDSDGVLSGEHSGLYIHIREKEEKNDIWLCIQVKKYLMEVKYCCKMSLFNTWSLMHALVVEY